MPLRPFRGRVPLVTADAGNSMVEVLVSVVLLGTTGVGLFGALLACIDGASEHQQTSSVLAGLSHAGEVLASTQVDYVSCGVPQADPVGAYTERLAELVGAGERVTVTIVGLRTWDGAGFVDGCPPGGGDVLQMIELSGEIPGATVRQHVVTKLDRSAVEP